MEFKNITLLGREKIHILLNTNQIKIGEYWLFDDIPTGKIMTKDGLKDFKSHKEFLLIRKDMYHNYLLYKDKECDEIEIHSSGNIY